MAKKTSYTISPRKCEVIVWEDAKKLSGEIRIYQDAIPDTGNTYFAEGSGIEVKVKFLRKLPENGAVYQYKSFPCSFDKKTGELTGCLVKIKNRSAEVEIKFSKKVLYNLTNRNR